MCRINPNMDDASVMTMAGNVDLGAAKAARNDEFYTQWNDIEIEMQAYLEYDPDVFRDKTVLLQCDDPGASNFTKYFALNFEKFGLKKLISTSYAPASNPAVTTASSVQLKPTGRKLKKSSPKPPTPSPASSAPNSSGPDVQPPAPIAQMGAEAVGLSRNDRN